MFENVILFLVVIKIRVFVSIVHSSLLFQDRNEANIPATLLMNFTCSFYSFR